MGPAKPESICLQTAGMPTRALPGACSLLLSASILAATTGLLSSVFTNEATACDALRHLTLANLQHLAAPINLALPHQSGGQLQAATLRRPATTCPNSLDIQQSTWSQQCTLLEKVCVDQGSIVLYDRRFQPGRDDSLEPPQFHAEGDFGAPGIIFRSGFGTFDRKGPTIRSRPLSVLKGVPYPPDPTFSCQTVPIVWFPYHMTNFAHYLRDNAARLFGAIQDTPWRDNIKLVQATPEGLDMPAFNYQLLQPLSALRVETWADFSTRVLPGTMYLETSDQPPSSAEGGLQRCFQHMFVCNRGPKNFTARWPLHEYGQQVAAAYMDSQPPEVQAVAGHASAIRQAVPASDTQQALEQQQPEQPGSIGSSRKIGSSGSPAAASSDDDRNTEVNAASAASSGSETVLNVVFQKRASRDSRQLLNSAELLDHCNSWAYRTQGGRRLRAKCWEAEMSDLASGIAASQQADVMVGTHGANMANGWLMRPGSSMIELQAYGYDTHKPHLQYPVYNAQDPGTQVVWWVLMGCDPQGFQPDFHEASGKGAPANWYKNRNIVLPWQALDTALRQVAETGGNMQRYRELWQKGEWWWHVHSPSNITYGGNRSSICSLPHKG